MQAAQAGLPEAKLSLGVMYYYGVGTAKDNTKAVQYVNDAANTGLSEAQYYMGMIYQNGLGVAQDQQKAHEYYLKAAQQGHIKAKLALEKLSS